MFAKKNLFKYIIYIITLIILVPSLVIIYEFLFKLGQIVGSIVGTY